MRLKSAWIIAASSSAEVFSLGCPDSSISQPSRFALSPIARTGQSILTRNHSHRDVNYERYA